MTGCEHYRPLLLDHQYGLLDPAEAATLDAHLTGCPGCASALVEVDRWHELLSVAAKGVGPAITFTPPAHPTAGVKSSFLVTPADPNRWTASHAISRWVVAAGLLLAFAALGGPAALDLAGSLRYRPAVQHELAKVEAAQADRDRLAAEFAAGRNEIEAKYATARNQFDRLVGDWSAAETTARNRPFAVDVRGPAVAQPGAPNEYAVRVVDRQGRPHPARIEAAVKDQAGRVVHSHTFLEPTPAQGGTFRLPSHVWADVKPGADLFLHVSAVDEATGARSELADKVRLADPVYTTFLTTDKPAYRPG